jgi:predicted SAM-dependent methyltransferase
VSSAIGLIEPPAEWLAAWEAGAGRRLNIGAGDWSLRGYTNLDAMPFDEIDIVATVPPIPYPDASLDEIYMGHVLEHFDYDAGQTLLKECWRVLVPGGKLGVTVPDTREVIKRWLREDNDFIQGPPGHWWPIADLDSVCALFAYSTIQESRHQWMYDQMTLKRAIKRAGFVVTGDIHPYVDPRVSVGAWYQMGVDSIKPA